MVGGGALAYVIGYNDEVRRILQWVISGTGIALILSVLNVSRLASFKCPRCGELFFFGIGAPAKVFSKQCGNCGLPLVPHDQPTPDAE